MYYGFMDGKTFEQLRKETLDLLEHNFAHNVITIEEYEKRVDIALNTSIEADLVRISGDLKALPVQEDQAHGGNAASVDGPISSKSDDLIISVLSGIRRRGAWNPAMTNKVISLLGNVHLDFTKVELPKRGVIEINFFCLMGNLDILVPEGVRIEFSGIPVMGNIENRTTSPRDSNCPVLKIRGLTLMGNVDMRNPGKRWGWRRHGRR